jgi:hypothetical protein
MTEIEVLVPVAESRVEDGPLAPRPPDLAGRRVGLLDNGKANAGLLLATVADDLAARAGRFDLVAEGKVATSAAPREVMDRLVRCDAVVLAIAD